MARPGQTRAMARYPTGIHRHRRRNRNPIADSHLHPRRNRHHRNSRTSIRIALLAAATSHRCTRKIASLLWKTPPRHSRPWRITRPLTQSSNSFLSFPSPIGRTRRDQPHHHEPHPSLARRRRRGSDSAGRRSVARIRPRNLCLFPRHKRSRDRLQPAAACGGPRDHHARSNLKQRRRLGSAPFALSFPRARHAHRQHTQTASSPSTAAALERPP